MPRHATPTQVDQFFTPSEACARLRIGRTKLHEELKSGRLPFLRIGRAVRIGEAALARWVAERMSVRQADMQA